MIIFKKCSCGNEYKTYSHIATTQAICPTCRVKGDVTKNRGIHSIVINRKCTFSTPVRIKSLPGTWQHMNAIKSNATPYWRMEVRGSMFGSNWGGQITIFASMKKAPVIGDVVFLRRMKAKKAVKTITFTNSAGRSSTVTLPISTKSDDIPSLIAEGVLNPLVADSPLMHTVVEHDYLVLDHTYRLPIYDLIWQCNKVADGLVVADEIYGVRWYWFSS